MDYSVDENEIVTQRCSAAGSSFERINYMPIHIEPRQGERVAIDASPHSYHLICHKYLIDSDIVQLLS